MNIHSRNFRFQDHQYQQDHQRNATNVGVQIVFAACVFCILSTASAASTENDRKSCLPFSKYFLSESQFVIRDWPGRKDGLRLAEPAATKIRGELRIVNHTVRLSPHSDSNRKIWLLGNGRDSFTTDINDEISPESISLSGPLSIDLTTLTDDSRTSLFGKTVLHSDFRKSVEIWESSHDGLFRIDFASGTEETALKSAILKPAVTTLTFPKDMVLSVIRFDPENKTVDLRFGAQGQDLDGVDLTFRDFRGLVFQLPHSMTFDMIPPDASRGGLAVKDSLRAIERISLKLEMTHKTVAFGDFAVRGCMAIATPGKKLEFKHDEEVLSWHPIASIANRPLEAGRSIVDAVIPKMDEEVENFGPAATWNHIFSNNQDNTDIWIMAANEHRIVYSGHATHFVGDRSLAILAGLVGFGVAYLIPCMLWTWSRRSKHYTSPNLPWSVLNLIRGRNGTASLSNLQIYWWTLSVFGLLVFTWVATGGLAQLNTSIVILLGVTSGGSLAAKAVAIQLNSATQSVGSLQGSTEMVKARWWDLISSGEQVSLTKLQMLIFTLFVALYVVSTVIGQLQFPEIPVELLTLMGISNGVYVLGKATGSNLYVQLAALRVQFESVAGEIVSSLAELKRTLTATQEQSETDRKTGLETAKKKLHRIVQELGNIEKTESGLSAEIQELEKRVATDANGNETAKAVTELKEQLEQLQKLQTEKVVSEKEIAVLEKPDEVEPNIEKIEKLENGWLAVQAEEAITQRKAGIAELNNDDITRLVEIWAELQNKIAKVKAAIKAKENAVINASS